MVSGLLKLHVMFSLELNPINEVSKKEESHHEARNQAV